PESAAENVLFSTALRRDRSSKAHTAAQLISSRLEKTLTSCLIMGGLLLCRLLIADLPRYENRNSKLENRETAVEFRVSGFDLCESIGNRQSKIGNSPRPHEAAMRATILRASS